jgi:hypothetical protein
VNENVFAYSNRAGGERSLVVYNNKYDSTQGTIHISAAAMDKGAGQLRQRSLAEGLALPDDDSVILAYRARGLEYLRRVSDIRRHGLSFDLHGFECVVLLDWRERRSTAEYPWDRLCDTLHGAGVPNLDEELAKLRLRPLHDALREAVSPASIHALALRAAELAAEAQTAGAIPNAAYEPQPDPRLQALTEKSQLFFDRLVEYLPEETRRSILSPTPSTASKPPAIAPAPSYPETVEALACAATHLPLLAKNFSTNWPAKSRPILPAAEPANHRERVWAPILAWIILRSLPTQSNPVELLDLFDRLLLRSALADIFASLGMEGESRWQAAAQVRLLLTPASAAPDAIRTGAFFSDPDARWLAGVNTADGVAWFNKEQFEELLTWLQLPALLQVAQQPSARPVAVARIEASVASAKQSAQAAGYNLDSYLAVSPRDPESRPTHQPALAKL